MYVIILVCINNTSVVGPFNSQYEAVEYYEKHHWGQYSVKRVEKPIAD